MAGVFDLFHVGHVDVLERARRACDRLVVGVLTDEWALDAWGARPFVPLVERAQILENLRCVDEVVVVDGVRPEWLTDVLGVRTVFAASRLDGVLGRGRARRDPARADHRPAGRPRFPQPDPARRHRPAPVPQLRRMTRRLPAARPSRSCPEAQKPSAGTPAYSRFVNRRIGRVFAAAAFLGHRTPNQVSLASGFCSLIGIVLIALVRPSLPLALAVTALLVLGYGLDSADGQLARLRGGGSPLGEWLDHMIDSIKIVLLHSAVLISFYRFDAFSNELVLLVPLAYVCMSSVLFFGLILIDQLRRRHGGAQQPNQRGDSVLKSLLIAPTDYGVLCLVFLAFGTPSLFIVLYGALLAANLLFLAAAIAKWYREMAVLGASA